MKAWSAPTSQNFSGSANPAAFVDRKTARKPENRHLKGSSKHLWLAVYFPYLAVETAGGSDRGALAVVETSPKGWIVYQACNRAERFGIRSGMTSSAANALHHGLTLRPRNPALEQQKLEQLAGCMLNFTPTVSIVFPATLLLEIRPSLKLFGGHRALAALINKRLEDYGHAFKMGTAATPKAAQLLTFLEDGPAMAADREGIRSRLGGIPTGLLALDEKVKKRLHQTGIHTMKDLWRLPRNGLARRYGRTLLHYLEQVLGERADPQTPYRPPFNFSQKLDFDYASGDLAHLKQAANHLLQGFVAYLRRRDRGTNAFQLEFLPEQGSRSVYVDVGLRSITRDLKHLDEVVVERLDQSVFFGPIAAVILRSTNIYPFDARNHTLFEDETQSEQQWRQCEEMIQAHMPDHPLDTLHVVAEHRPEYAFRKQPENHSDPPGCPEPARPLWLLKTPKPLPMTDGGTWPEDHAAMLEGPERIETGWWDGRDIRRDYYVARDARGSKLWIFQDLRNSKWYLHGRFG